jgi:sugar phosphate permease
MNTASKCSDYLIYTVGLLGLFFMLAYLDRSNLGNANITSMPTDIGLSGNQFGTAVTLFYATYAPAEAPMGILLKIVGPNYLLSFCAFSWGLTTLCMGFIRNVGDLYACRLLLGVL